MKRPKHTPAADRIVTTMAEVLNAEPALGRLLQTRLPVKTAYQLAKIARAVKIELEHFHEQRLAYVKELGTERDATPDERASGLHGRLTAVLPDRLDEFQQRVTALGALDVTIPGVPLTLADLAGIDIAAGDLLVLDMFIKDGA